MHGFSFSKYLKNEHKGHDYNCLYIGNLKKIAYCTYPYYLDVFLYKNMSKIPNAKGAHFIIYKDLTSIKIKVYDEYFNNISNYKK